MITDININITSKTHSDYSGEIFEKEISKNKTYFFGVRFDNISKSVAIKTIQNFLMDNKKPRRVFFTNVHTFYLAKKDPSFAQIVNNADLVLPDGSGIATAGKLFSNPVKENLNGTDLTPAVLETASKSGATIYLLGATEDVVNTCVIKLKYKYPGLKIIGSHSGYFSDKEEKNLIDKIKILSPDILLIAMGSPIQEFIADRISKELSHTICFAVGGLFDFIAGVRKRAPLIFRKTGIEWIYRFFQDPKSKWERIVKEIPLFLLSVLSSKLFTNNIYSSFDRRPCTVD